jgi:predicted transcriptional regulator
MKKNWYAELSRRERQIMDIVYQQGSASVNDVMEYMADPPSYSSVRALMNILKEKKHLKIRKDGVRYLYLPTRPRTHAGRPALKRVVETFFDNSVEKTVAALLKSSDTHLSQEELDRLTELINRAKK